MQFLIFSCWWEAHRCNAYIVTNYDFFDIFTYIVLEAGSIKTKLGRLGRKELTV